MKSIGLLGGSFNPVHVGHLRLAIEITEALQPERLDLIPSAIPPHKNRRGLLPFDLRMELLQIATSSMPRIRVNPIEATRPGPSYTWDTLRQYRHDEPDARLFFILGGEDFNMLQHWHRGLELPLLADLVVVPRAGADRGSFLATAREHWPESFRTDVRLPGDGLALELPGGTRLIYLPLPRLDISSSLLRDKWLAGADLSLLVPDPVLEALKRNSSIVKQCWVNPATSAPQTKVHGDK